VSAIFDCDLQETHELTNIVTEHPVEEGADVSDNVRPQLARFAVEGFVSDNPTINNPDVVNQASFVDIELQIPEKNFQPSISAAIGAAVSAIGDALTGGPAPLQVKMLRFDNFKSRKRAAFDLLEDARTNARVIRAITTLHEYENMVIEQITVTRSSEDGSGATFSVALKEVSFVSSDITIAPEPAELLGAITKAVGGKSAKDDKAKVEEVKKSILASGADSLGEAFGF